LFLLQALNAKLRLELKNFNRYASFRIPVGSSRNSYLSTSHEVTEENSQMQAISEANRAAFGTVRKKFASRKGRKKTFTKHTFRHTQCLPIPITQYILLEKFVVYDVSLDSKRIAPLF
jgi:hypothetical protein